MTNLETESRKLLQVVLFGQPELNDKLALPELRQLRQRITFSYTLQLMDADQVYQYVQHRMRISGYIGTEVFDRRCADWLFKASKGTPRIVNVLCHKALMLVYGKGAKQVGIKDLRAAIADTESAQPVRYSYWIVWTLALLVCMLFTLFVYYFPWSLI
jgi:MSHA biogenesis protein MshM